MFRIPLNYNVPNSRLVVYFLLVYLGVFLFVLLLVALLVTGENNVNALSSGLEMEFGNFEKQCTTTYLL